MGERNQEQQCQSEREDSDYHALCKWRQQRQQLLLLSLPDHHQTQRSTQTQAECGSVGVKHPQVLCLLARFGQCGGRKTKSYFLCSVDLPESGNRD